MSFKTCVWRDLFDDNERNILRDGFFLTGLVAVLLSVWLNLALRVTTLQHDQSYRNLFFFTVTACIRRIVPALSSLRFFEYIKTWHGYQAFPCAMFGFWDTFLAVLEIEALTHVCIERYVVAKYITNGWPIPQKHYYLFMFLCMLFASLYSYPALFGLGQYGYDFPCTSCTFDMVLPDTNQKYLVVVIFLLRSVKPLLFMTTMLIWCCKLEKKYNNSKEHQKQITFTKSAITVTFVNLLCWTPIALLRGWVVLYQLIYNGVLIKHSVFYIKWAMWLHWVAPAMTAIALSVVDARVRCKMFRFYFPDEDAKEDDNKND